MITLGVYAWFQIDISPNVIAALLTIMGYSLYDTVVEFNRMQVFPSRETAVPTQASPRFASFSENP